MRRDKNGNRLCYVCEAAHVSDGLVCGECFWRYNMKKPDSPRAQISYATYPVFTLG